MSNFDPTNTTGRPTPRMTIIIPLMKGTMVEQQEGYRKLLGEAKIFVSADKITTVITNGNRKVVTKVTKGDTPDANTGIYLALVKYLTNWRTSRLETYIKRRVPKLERTEFDNYKKTVLETLPKTLKKEEFNSIVTKLNNEEILARQRIEKAVALELVMKLTGYNEDKIKSVIKRRMIEAKFNSRK